MNCQLLVIFIVFLLGTTSNSLKCKFLSTDITQAESPEEQLMINKTSETTEYECPAEDKNCVNMKGFLTKIDPETGEQKNMTFGLKSCESDLARLMAPFEQRIEQNLNYTCGASSNNENQTVGPITYSLDCCSTDECNVSNDNNNNTVIQNIFPSEDITTEINEENNNNKENENPLIENGENNNNKTFVLKENNNQENPIFTENGENNNKTFMLTENEEFTSTPFLLDSSTQSIEPNNNNTNTTKENPRNGVSTIHNTFTMFSLLSTFLLIGSLMMITY